MSDEHAIKRRRFIACFDSTNEDYYECPTAWKVMKAAHPALKQDVPSVLAALARDAADTAQYMETHEHDMYKSTSLMYVHASLKKNKLVVLAAVWSNGYALRYAAKALQKDRDVVLAAVRQNGLALQYADAAFTKDKEVVLVALTQNVNAFPYVSETLYMDKDVVAVRARIVPLFTLFEDYAAHDVAALGKEGGVVLSALSNRNNCVTEILAFADAALVQDVSFLLRAVGVRGAVFGYLPASLQKDRDFVLAAVAANGEVVQEHALGKEFKNDKTVVRTAVQQNGTALAYASPALQMDKEIVLAAAATSPYDVMLGKCVALRDDKDVVLAAVKSNGLVLRWIDEKWREDRDVVRAAVSSKGMALLFAAKEFQKDIDVARVAVANCGNALMVYVARTKEVDADLTRLALSTRRKAAEYAGQCEAWKRAGPKQVAFLLRRLPLPHDVVHAHILPHFADYDNDRHDDKREPKHCLLRMEE